LGLERIIGIKWNYHPDAETYILEGPVVALVLIENGYLGLFNNFYYIISFLCSANINCLIFLNIIFYSLTNVLIFIIFKRSDKKYLLNLPFWILVLVPYRIHLAVHVLKDTIIIFSLVLILSRTFFSKLSYIFILLMRVFSVFYFIVLIPRKYYIQLLLISLLLFLFYNDILIEFLAEKNDTNMTFRDFDKVPTFNELGLFGVFIRALVWPIFVMTGFYLFVSPSVAFFPVAIGAFMIQLWCKLYLNIFSLLIEVYFSCFVIGLFVNGFTSYLRYTFPLILIIPLLELRNKDNLYSNKSLV
jgi:hypothetical protein